MKTMGRLKCNQGRLLYKREPVMNSANSESSSSLSMRDAIILAVINAPKHGPRLLIDVHPMKTIPLFIPLLEEFAVHCVFTLRPRPSAHRIEGNPPEKPARPVASRLSSAMGAIFFCIFQGGER
jgi:hypothetical protein